MWMLSKRAYKPIDAIYNKLSTILVNNVVRRLTSFFVLLAYRADDLMRYVNGKTKFALLQRVPTKALQQRIISCVPRCVVCMLAASPASA